MCYLLTDGTIEVLFLTGAVIEVLFLTDGTMEVLFCTDGTIAMLFLTDGTMGSYRNAFFCRWHHERQRTVVWLPTEQFGRTVRRRRIF